MSRAPLAIGGRRQSGGANAHARRRPRPHLRRSRWLMAVGLFVALAAAGAGAFWLVRSETFVVTRVESGPYRFTEEAALETALTRLLGCNLLTLRQEEAERALADLPWIRSVRITRHLPATLVVNFREWRPVLAVATADAEGPEDLVLREDGRVVAMPDHLLAPALPVLVGVPLEAADEGGWRLAEAHFGPLRGLLDALAASGLESVAPLDFLLARDDGYDIVLQEGRGRMKVGREDFHRRLQKYLAARERIPSGVSVDLRYRDRISYRPANI